MARSCESPPSVEIRRARPGRFVFPDDSTDFLKAGLPKHAAVKGQRARQQLVQQDAQGIDVAADIDVRNGHPRLFRAHVLRRAEKLSLFSKDRLFRERLLQRLCQAEVDDFRCRLIVDHGDKDVRGLDVAVNDAFLMGVLDRLANREKEPQPLFQAELVRVAVGGDRLALDQFHDKVGTAVLCHTRVEDPGNVGVVHQRQGVPLGLEACQNLARVHARLEDLDCHATANGLLLIGKIDDTKTTFAEDAAEFIRPNARTQHGVAMRSGRRGCGVQLHRLLKNGFDQVVVLREPSPVLGRCGRIPVAPAIIQIEEQQFREQCFAFGAGSIVEKLLGTWPAAAPPDIFKGPADPIDPFLGL